MARSTTSRAHDYEADYAEIIDWYKDQIAHQPPPPRAKWEPIILGPTWRRDENGWILPEHTLGWRRLAWCGVWLRGPDGGPWEYTPEQARFILHFDAIDENGRLLNHSAFLQRLKGWGKDPLAATVCASSMLADLTFDHWGPDGQPVGREEENAWIRVVAVSEVQTQNTMKLFPSMIPAETRRRYGISVGKQNIYAMNDTRQIQAITSSPLAVEGGRPTLNVINEPQNWVEGNHGHDMHEALEGDATKSANGAARMLYIGNAYRPTLDSVAERVRDAWEDTQGINGVQAFGLMFDSLEAPPDAPLTAKDAPEVLEAIRGDATWLDIQRIVDYINKGSNSAAESRRKWYNQITTVADAWVDPVDVKLCEVDDEIQPGDRVVMFGDGSKSGDETGLVLCRLSDGLIQVHHRQAPRHGQFVDRMSLDLAVAEAHEKYRVYAFWFDPSHAKDDDAEEDDRWLWPLVDEWSTRYGRRYKMHPVQTGHRKHAVAFDMLLPSSNALIVPAYMQTASDIGNHELRFHRSAPLKQHMRNARRHPSKYGMTIGKPVRNSSKKIDLAVCTSGARMMWRMAKLRGASGTPGKGRIILLDD